MASAVCQACASVLRLALRSGPTVLISLRVALRATVSELKPQHLEDILSTRLACCSILAREASATVLDSQRSSHGNMSKTALRVLPSRAAALVCKHRTYAVGYGQCHRRVWCVSSPDLMQAQLTPSHLQVALREQSVWEALSSVHLSRESAPCFLYDHHTARPVYHPIRCGDTATTRRYSPPRVLPYQSPLCARAHETVALSATGARPHSYTAVCVKATQAKVSSVHRCIFALSAYLAALRHLHRLPPQRQLPPSTPPAQRRAPHA